MLLSFLYKVNVFISIPRFFYGIKKQVHVNVPADIIVNPARDPGFRKFVSFFDQRFLYLRGLSPARGNPFHMTERLFSHLPLLLAALRQSFWRTERLQAFHTEFLFPFFRIFRMFLYP